MKKIYEDIRKKAAYKAYEGNVYEISGDNAEDELNEILTKNIEFVDIDTCGYCFLLTDEGELQADIIYYKLDSSYLLFSTVELIDFLNELEDVTVKNRTNELKLIQVEGKESLRIAQKFYDYDISTLNYKSVVCATFKDKNILLSRFGYTGEFGYQFVLDLKHTDAFIQEILIAENVIEYNEQVEKYTKFEVGHPIEDLYKNSEYNIHELGFTWNVDFTKMNFKGKDALLEKVKQSSYNHIGFYSEDIQESGTEVLFDNQVVGKINIVFNALEETNAKKCIGSLMLDNEYAYSGLIFTTKKGNKLYTMANPYVIPESWAANE